MYRFSRFQGFSLLELISVVAVLLVLIMVAAPAFRSNYAKQQLAQTLKLAINIEDQLKLAYFANGVMPNTINYKGTDIAIGQTLVTNETALASIQYSPSVPDNLGRMFIFNINSIQGIANASGPLVVAFGVRDFNGTIKIGCGSPNNGGTVPFAALPSNCQCANVDVWASAGTASTGCP